MYTPECCTCFKPRSETAMRCGTCPRIEVDAAQMAAVNESPEMTRARTHDAPTNMVFTTVMALMLGVGPLALIFAVWRDIPWAGRIVPLAIGTLTLVLYAFRVIRWKRPEPRVATVIGATRIPRGKAMRVALAFADGSEAQYWKEWTFDRELIGTVVIAFIARDELYELWPGTPTATVAASA